jgi:hypothetical protein
MKKAKLHAIAALAIVCSTVALSSKQGLKPSQSNLWVGVTYTLAEVGAPNGATAAIGVFGVGHATLHSAAWGAAFGGPAGLIAGAVVGL